MLDYVWLIPLFPAIGFVTNGLLGRRLGSKAVSWIACSALGLSFLTSILIFLELIGRPPAERLDVGLIDGDQEDLRGQGSRPPQAE